MENFDFTILRELRKNKGVSQAQLSESCGITVQTICALEKGRYTPSLSTVTSIARALEVDFAELVDYACMSDPKLFSCSSASTFGIERQNCKVFDFNSMMVLNSDYLPGEDFCNHRFPLCDLYLISIGERNFHISVDGHNYNLNGNTALYHDGMSGRIATIDEPGKVIGVAVPRLCQFTRIFGNARNRILSLAQDFTPSSQLLNGLDFSVLKLIRAARNISIESLADKSGVSEQAISDIELNKRAPILSTISNISKALDISISDIMDFAWRRDPQSYEFQLLHDYRETVKGDVIASRVVLGDIIIDYVKNMTEEKSEISCPADPFMEIAAIPLKGQVETLIDGKSYIYGPGHALKYHCNKGRVFKCSPGFEIVVVRRLKRDYFSILNPQFN